MTKTLRLLLALSLLAGCHSQAPYDPQADCPKETYCGQCASRGACAWCGDPSDSSKGQCVAVGHAECAAPQAWSKTPDHCPAPPASTAATASTSSATSPTAQEIGAEKYNAIQRALKRAFPQANVNDDVIAKVAHLLPGPPGAPKLVSSPGKDVAPVARRVHEKDHRLYLGDATHHRVKSAPPESKPMQSEFTMSLPMVRVSLPERLEADKSIIETEIGDVDLSRDHLLGSIDLVNGKYGGAGYLGYRPERVDLITPARAAGTRFGAIAVYLGYRKKADRGPAFYMLEAGTATGDAKMIYFSPDMKMIPSVTSYYLPTPFVTMNNTYSGGVTMKPAPDEDEPEQLVIHSHTPGDKDPYITVTLKYRRSPTMDVPLPFEITADAAARIALIAKTMGLSSAIELQPALAELANTLHWKQYPHYVTPAPSAPPVAH
jgi:hypothetical protein